ncbi:hypothetical protein JOB18_032437 [Solea senegalensis]|uniref:Uncharacterized protein n=1 Tax=Solea senegalensis TaxID=28829 RepID=A0AAV6Q484_SOLSE|nr:hypothetical protein JOB18_032437 [Solea senegalensis]
MGHLITHTPLTNHSNVQSTVRSEVGLCTFPFPTVGFNQLTCSNERKQLSDSHVRIQTVVRRQCVYATLFFCEDDHMI